MIDNIIYWIVTPIILFLLWTFTLYWIHRFAHKIPFIKKYHQDHHCYIIRHGGSSWRWNNLFLFNETWKSTADLWITEVIPTLLLSAVTGVWWLVILYYLWSALLQEVIEHNPNFDRYPLITSGKWHLVHHATPKKNFGLFIPVWDKLFGTELLPQRIGQQTK